MHIPTGPVTPEEMVLLCESVVLHTSRLFSEGSLRKQMRVDELYAFAMATVTEIYTLGQGSATKAAPVLDQFHSAMEVRIETRFLREPALQTKDIDQLMASFFDLLRVRYPLYGRAIRRDVLQKPPTWLSLARLTLDCLLSPETPTASKDGLLIPVALSIATTVASAIDELFPQKPA